MLSFDGEETMKGRRRGRGQYIETRLSVDRGGDWRSFTDTLPKSCAVIGTVTEDCETWRFEESNGNYNFYGYGTKSEAEQFKEELMKDDEPYHYYSIDLGTLPHESEQYEYLDLRDLKKGIEEFQTARMEAVRKPIP
jgi:hypothetical protein